MKKKQMIMTRLMILQMNKCYYCRCKMSMSVSTHDPKRATFDHISLACEGGPVDMENGVAACRTCNELRGIKCWLRWLRFSRQNGYQQLVTNVMVAKSGAAKPLIQESITMTNTLDRLKAEINNLDDPSESNPTFRQLRDEKNEIGQRINTTAHAIRDAKKQRKTAILTIERAYQQAA